MKTKKLKQILIFALILIIGIFLGKLFFGGQPAGPANGAGAGAVHQHESKEAEVWTCSMHPQIRQDKPGNCPICGMELIPVEAGSGSGDPAILEMTPESVKIANIQTSTVALEKPVKELVLNGKVKVDERLIHNQIAQIPGRIEKLYVNFTGQKVEKGQKLASIYSPRLVTAQEELFEAIKYKESNPGLVEAARTKLRLWKLTDKQISEIESKGEIRTEIDVLADHSGYVLSRNVSFGDEVMKGKVLFEIANLDKLWIMFDAYESDISWMKIGDRINFSVASYPGEEFAARISYIDPVINPRTRVASVRTEIANHNGRLKPEMFVIGKILARLPFKKEAIVVPKSSVMWTGKRSIVYVQVPDTKLPAYEMREVILGQELGESYIIESGLQQGEEVVTNGAFKIDAAAQLSNKSSMMNRNIKIKGEPEDDKPKLPDYTSDTPDEFKNQLKSLISSYLKLTDALVKSDDKSARKHSKVLIDNIKKVDHSLLNSDGHKYWMGLHKTIKGQNDELTIAANIDQQRKAYIKLSDAIIKAARVFGAGMDLFVLHCPMANDNNGANWLSLKDKVLNPYYGDMMLSCGSVEGKIAK